MQLECIRSHKVVVVELDYSVKFKFKMESLKVKSVTPKTPLNLSITSNYKQNNTYTVFTLISSLENINYKNTITLVCIICIFVSYSHTI